MYLAKVTGTVVASQKADGLEGVRLLLVERVGDDLKPQGSPQVATDAVQAGVGELVYVCTGREASMALAEPFVPVDLCIVGHVDDVMVTETTEKAKAPATKKPAPRRRAKATRKRRAK